MLFLDVAFDQNRKTPGTVSCFVSAVRGLGRAEVFSKRRVKWGTALNPLA
jgi:hypothetical protein